MAHPGQQPRGGELCPLPLKARPLDKLDNKEIHHYLFKRIASSNLGPCFRRGLGHDAQGEAMAGEPALGRGWDGITGISLSPKSVSTFNTSSLPKTRTTSPVQHLFRKHRES